MDKCKKSIYIVIIVFCMLIINIYSNYFCDTKSYSKLVYAVMLIAYILNYILSYFFLIFYGKKKLNLKEFKLKTIITLSLIQIILLVLNVIILLGSRSLIENDNMYNFFNLTIYSVFGAAKMIILYYILINDRKYMFKFSDILAVVIYCLAYVYLIYSIPSTNADTPQEMFTMMLIESPRIHLESILRGIYDCVLLVYLLLSYKVRIKNTNKTTSLT